MRTLAIKLLGLLVLLAGVLLAVAVLAPAGMVTGLLIKIPDLTAPPAEGGVVDWRLVGGVAGACFVLLGLTCLLPLNRRKGSSISFRGDSGEIIVALDPVQKTLAKLINALPEVRWARVQVIPEPDGRRVKVRVEVMLQNQADHGLRKTANLVSDCVSHAVCRTMGLEDLATVLLVVKGVHVDVRAAARHIREGVEVRSDHETTRLAVAVACPPISSVTMEDLKTPDPAPAATVVFEETEVAGAEPAAECAAAPATGPATEIPAQLSPITLEEPETDAAEPVADAGPAPESAAESGTEAESDAAEMPMAVAALEVPVEATAETYPGDAAHRPQS